LVNDLAGLKNDWVVSAGRSWLAKRFPALSINEAAI